MIIICVILLLAICVAAYRLDRRHNTAPALPDTLHGIYQRLIASGQYTWRQFGTRRKARQAARREAKARMAMR